MPNKKTNVKKTKKVKSKVKEILEKESPKVDLKRVKFLRKEIKRDCPSVQAMKANALNTLRRSMDHERRVRPLLVELSILEGREVTIESLRLGRS